MAYENDVLTRNNDDELAVRVVQSDGDNPASAYDDIYTRDNNGKLAVRVTGAGGGSVDYNRVIEKSVTIPAATSSNVGKVYMYTGETNSTYTHGYIYENQETTVYTDSVEFNPASISGTTVTATAGALASLCEEYGSGNITDIIKGTLTYDLAGGLLVFVGLDDTDTQVCTFQLYTEDYEDAGFTFTGTLQDGDVIAFTCTISESSEYGWVRIDVQPAGSSGDPHNLGWYATASALQTAHPTATAGDWAIVGATDTVWIWDTDANIWKDSDTKGQVTSVNGATGAVTIGANDVLPTQTGYSGRVLGTDGFVAGWVEPTTITFRTWGANE